ncbi:MAG: DMT family transporter [Thermoplasmata archaeon]|nr:DMT family transporter [Thermoplasmata archaeon]
MKKVEIVALAITASIMWGASFPVIKIGLENVPPVLFGTLRYVIAVPLFLLLSLVLYGKKLFSIRDDIPLFIALGLVGVTMPTVLQNYGMMHTTAYMSSILQSTGPVFTVLLAAYFLKEKLTWYKTAGIIIASAGTYLALDIHFSSLGSSVGNALVLLSAVSYAVGGIIAKTCLNRGYKPVQILMLSSLFGTAVLVVITPFSGNISLGFSAETWGLILFLAVVSTFLPYTLWYAAMEKTELSRLSFFVYLIPVFATIFSYFMIGERITWLAVLAAAIIITGITIAQTHRNLNAM